MFRVAIGEWTLECQPDGLPSIYHAYREHAALADVIGLDEIEGAACFIAVRPGHDWPILIVAQRYSPTSAAGFHPGALIVPETRLLFLGAGTRLLAYRLDGPERLWEDATDAGFWGWQRHGDFVVMSAELELAAWDLCGTKLWSTDVEPPWTYAVVEDDVRLDAVDRKSSFPLATGPTRSPDNGRPRPDKTPGDGTSPK